MKIEESFILREIAGDYVVVPTFNGLITINGTGAYLWEQLSEERTIEELAKSVCQEYEVDEESARRDTEEFVELLRRYEILENNLDG